MKEQWYALNACNQHLLNLCNACNKAQDEMRFNDRNALIAQITAAANMAKTFGFSTEIWMDYNDNRIAAIYTTDTETDETLLRTPKEYNQTFYRCYKFFCGIAR